MVQHADQIEILHSPVKSSHSNVCLKFSEDTSNCVFVCKGQIKQRKIQIIMQIYGGVIVIQTCRWPNQQGPERVSFLLLTEMSTTEHVYFKWSLDCQQMKIYWERY